MQIEVSATFEVKNWDESPIDAEEEVPKVTRAVVSRAYAGDLSGRSTTEWVMAYSPDGSATFVGMERVVGTVGERAGTLVLQHVGNYAEGSAGAELSVVEGSGSGELGSAKGSGSFKADPNGSMTLSLTFD
jgi:Protein of unknown function (DUF3224)